MSLRTRFGIITVILGLTFACVFGVFVWSLDTLHDHVTDHYRSTTLVLKKLAALKRTFEDEGAFVLGDTPSEGGWLGMRDPGRLAPRAITEEDHATFADEHHSNVEAALTALTRNDWSEARVGPGSVRNLERRTRLAQDLVASWLETGNEYTRHEAAAALYTLHELIETVESRLLDETDLAYQHSMWLRNRMAVIAIAAALLIICVLVLRLMLDRKWVLQPVAKLHEAAGLIGRGYLTYRVEVRGGDEIADLGREMNRMAGTVHQLQDERIEQERLAAVGEMVRRVAHNLRNPLAGIRGVAELLRREHEPGSRVYEKHNRIIETVDGCEHWLRQLLNVTSPLTVNPRDCRIPSWLSDLTATYRTAAESRGIELELRTDAAPPLARIDTQHLDHAIGSIIANAIEASPEDDTVVIEALAGGADWEILISDHGPGVPENLRDKLFKPYFTTKKGGNGIGLAAALRIINSHGGKVGFDCRPNGVGNQTTFRINLPLDPESSKTEMPNGESSGH